MFNQFKYSAIVVTTPHPVSPLQHLAPFGPRSLDVDEKRQYWEEKLGSQISEELLQELVGLAESDDPPMRVYLNTGEVEEVRPASAVEMTSDRLNVVYKNLTVASYARSSVFAASKSNISPFF
jgi:hypothetical protein